MPIVIEGIVRGGKILLIEGPDLVDGQRVRVMIEPESDPAEPSTTTEGAIHTPLEDPALIALLASVRHERRPLPPGPSGPGRTSAAGVFADDSTWDEHLRQALESRKSARHRELPE